MKRYIIITILLLTLSLNALPIFSEGAEDNVRTLDLSKVETYNKEGTPMVPLREIAENMLGLEVRWINENSSVEIGTGPQWTSITIDKNSYFFARLAPFKLSQPPEIVDGKTYVPVEFFSKVLKYEVILKDEEAKTIKGFISDITKTDSGLRLLVASDGKTKGLDLVLLTITDETILVDKNGDNFNQKELKIGHKVIVTLPKIMALSYPPQGTAIKIEVLDTNVEVEKIQDKANNNINFPKIRGLEKDMEDRINNQIRQFIDNIKRNDLYNELNLNYNLSLLDDSVISLVFRGNFNFYDSEKHLVKTLNIDLNTGDTVDFEDYFKSDKESQKQLYSLLKALAKEQDQFDFEAEGIEIYFKGSNLIVVYFPLDDSVAYPVELYIPLKDISELIKKD